MSEHYYIYLIECGCGLVVKQNKKKLHFTHMALNVAVVVVVAAILCLSKVSLLTC